MILYVYNSNAILVKPIKSQAAAELTCAYSPLYTYLIKCSRQPKVSKLDNKAPAALKDLFKQYNVVYQLALPHCHRCNSAEWAISIFKDHFLSGLSIANTCFPMHLWD